MTYKKTAGEFIFNVAKKVFGGNKQKTTGTGAVNKVDISKNLKKFQEQKDEIIKTTNKYTQGLTKEGKTNVRKFVAPALSKISKLTQKFPKESVKKRNEESKKMFRGAQGKAKGGRVGLKRGTNLEKIKKTFGSKKSDFGAQSVKYGLDKNYGVTKADRIAKFVGKKNKKKVI